MSDPRILETGHAPTPFTAEEIRAASPAGKSMTLRIESADGSTSWRTNRYVEVDADGAVIRRTRVTADGETIEELDAARAAWRDLQGHASFPAADVTITPETLETPMGALACLRYEVRGEGSVRTFWFAKELPGMPVRSEVRQGGRLVSTVIMVANSGAA